MISTTAAIHAGDAPHAPEGPSVALRSLRRNTTGRIDLSGVDAGDASVADAIGLSNGTPIRVARSGRCCIVEAHGSRIAVGRPLADHLRVWPDSDTPRH